MMRAALPAFRTAAAIWHAALQPVRSIPPQKSGTVGHAGGIAGSFNAGETLKDSVSAQTVINGVADVDKIVGQLDDEAATNITDNIAWEGTLLSGNEPTEQPIKWEDVSAAKMQDKATYAKHSAGI